MQHKQKFSFYGNTSKEYHILVKVTGVFYGIDNPLLLYHLSVVDVTTLRCLHMYMYHNISLPLDSYRRS